MAKSITGIVASKKTDKTIVIVEHVRLTHPLYRKQYTITKRFMAHDEKNEARQGDKVVIVETRPVSARKHFKLERIIEKAGVQHVESSEPAVPAAEASDAAAPETKKAAPASPKAAKKPAASKEKTS